MQPLKAQVRNGRLVLDEPTDLPEGKVIELLPLDEDDQDLADLAPAERAALLAELRVAIAQEKAGQVVDADEVLAEIRARRT
jgi:hypothetical protein